MLLTLLLALVLSQDLDKARTDLKKGVAASDGAAVEAAVQKIAAADNKRAVELLLEGYSECAKELKSLWDDKLRVIQENQSLPKYDKAADQKGQAIETNIRKVEALKRLVVRALGGLKSEAAVKALGAEVMARTFSASADWTRRAAVSEALGAIGHPDALAALLEVAKRDAEPQVRVAAIDALVLRKEATLEVGAMLVGLLGHESWQVKSAAVGAIRSLGLKVAVGPLVEALEKNDGRLRHEINEALIAFTGVDKHGDFAAWKAWWDANQEEVRAGTYKPRKEEAAGNQAGAATTFYGIPIRSKHVVFVLDRSGSMAKPSSWEIPPDVATGPGLPGGDIKKQGDRKIDIARWQLKRALAMLADGVEFNIIFYNHQWTTMSDTMVKLSAVTRKQAYEFIDATDPTGRTNIYDPLEKGLMFGPGGEKFPKGAAGARPTVATGDRAEKGYADTVFLLSDGLPNTGQIPDPDGIIAKVKELNRTRKLTINTIGVFATGDSEAEPGGRLLQQLSADSGGVHTSTVKPAAKKAP